MTHFETKFLQERLQNLDEQNISIGEYMQVGLLLKILETLNDIKRNMDGEK